mmetsp:Transcript_22682/g.52897  ORF Transcript_22682/g.52897 Transcript_22682/m.52897 type:complete len:250 (+) Transcript_22682:40-789(+)|eukprot:CAMPEP_0114561598 /NCGR_PEP_ID=MMETSP0114-20121206/12089_1 /TAXON_ID=31324 /ORGANISM="Goniomonas sp, Strain m" /LENGTH=249 /DNA_ID=CAMNT_0001747243 /DNA_START=35 /DNA_END=784 /DNA_ORIENTATION=-
MGDVVPPRKVGKKLIPGCRERLWTGIADTSVHMGLAPPPEKTPDPIRTKNWGAPVVSPERARDWPGLDRTRRHMGLDGGDRVRSPQEEHREPRRHPQQRHQSVEVRLSEEGTPSSSRQSSRAPSRARTPPKQRNQKKESIAVQTELAAGKPADTSACPSSSSSSRRDSESRQSGRSRQQQAWDPKRGGGGEWTYVGASSWTTDASALGKFSSKEVAQANNAVGAGRQYFNNYYEERHKPNTYCPDFKAK